MTCVRLTFLSALNWQPKSAVTVVKAVTSHLPSQAPRGRHTLCSVGKFASFRNVPTLFLSMKLSQKDVKEKKKKQ